MKKQSGLVAVGALVVSGFGVRVFGLLREILLAKYYGTSVYTDAYIIANNIPAVLFASIGASIASAYVPMYTRIRRERGEERAKRFTWNFLRVLVLICFLLCAVGEIFTDELVFLFASGFRGDAQSLTVRFSRILLPSLLAMALSNVQGAYLSIHGEFTAIAIVPAVSNLLIIFSLFASNALENPTIFIFGTLGGIFSQVLFYAQRSEKKRLSIWRAEDRTAIREDTYIVSLIALVVPVFAGEAVHDLNTIVDRTLVSALGTGSVSALNYAYKVTNIFTSIVMGAITTVFYPKLSASAAVRDWESLKKITESLIKAVVLVMIPFSCSLIAFRHQIILILFQRGNFDASSTALTEGALACYSIGLLGISLQGLFAKVFYSLQETKIPMINGVACTLLNIVLSVLLIRMMGINGAAFATSLVAVISSVSLFLTLRRRNAFRFPWKTVAAATGAGLAAYFPLYLLLRRLKISVGPAASVLLTCASVVIYGTLVLFLRIEPLPELLDELRTRLAKKFRPFWR